MERENKPFRVAGSVQIGDKTYSVSETQKSQFNTPKNQSFFETTSVNLKPQVSTGSVLAGAVSGSDLHTMTFKETVLKTQDYYSNRADTATQSVGGVIGAGAVSCATFKAGQIASDATIRSMNGVYRVGDTVLKLSQTAAGLYGAKMAGYIETKKDFVNQYGYFSGKTGFDKTDFAQKLVSRVENIRKQVETARLENAPRLNLDNGAIKISSNVGTRNLIANNAQALAHSAALKGKDALNVGTNITKKASGGIAKGGMLIATQIAENSDNASLSAVGSAADMSRYAAQAGKSTIKITRNTANVAYNTGKTIVNNSKKVYKSAQFIKDKGLKKAWEYSRRSIRTKIAKAGRSAASTLFNVLKKVGAKAILPIAIILALMVAISASVSAPVTVTSSLFGQSFTTKGSGKNDADWEINDYLMYPENVPKWRSDLIAELTTKYNKYLKKYDVVRFCCSNSGGEIQVSQLPSIIYADVEIAKIVQPVFNAVLIMDYELYISEDDASKLSQELFNSLFVLTEEVTSVNVGTDEYPRIITIMTMTLSMDGINVLIDKYFQKPIDKLSNKSSRTEDEEMLLENLIAFHELTFEFISEIEQERGRINVGGSSYSGGMRITDLDNISWVKSSRNGCEEVVDYALTQVGQRGGYPYWSRYFGNMRVEWCACFVQFCMEMTGNKAEYAQSQNNFYCPTLKNYFEGIGNWHEGGYTDLTAGDVIIFDWEADGIADHVGLVIGRDEHYVYTVEGNRGDSVKQLCYPLDSYQIDGYALCTW